MFSVKEETDQKAVDLEVVSGLKSSLEKVEKELQTTKEQKASLERECVIYQSQLDVSGHSIHCTCSRRYLQFPTACMYCIHICTCTCTCTPILHALYIHVHVLMGCIPVMI